MKILNTVLCLLVFIQVEAGFLPYNHFEQFTDINGNMTCIKSVTNSKTPPLKAQTVEGPCEDSGHNLNFPVHRQPETVISTYFEIRVSKVFMPDSDYLADHFLDNLMKDYKSILFESTHKKIGHKYASFYFKAKFYDYNYPEKHSPFSSRYNSYKDYVAEKSDHLREKISDSTGFNVRRLDFSYELF